ncbi:NPCBM/NEW2 domain-containing protein [Adhaeretor mobilis]|uniref:NPCBM/NEW2 domain protein n=1 Tax=Adhaeretor mobilis TaxID=1930276 RepID=A0A517MX24_9BACT|nr:NPCBM/NEW2 domain-containing protein [Adhaeretor mobilis]QDS99426.1 NPCBM/NEW2 domain protein [Adhaeretor mobilis]
MRPSLSLLIIVLLGGFTEPVRTCLAASVTTIDGQQESIQTFQIDEIGLETLTTDGSKRIAAADLLSVAINESSSTGRASSGTSPDMALATIDGTLLSIQHFEAAQRTALIRSPFSNETLEVPTEHIRYARLVPLTVAVEPYWSELLADQSHGDLLVVRKKSDSSEAPNWDSISGIVQQVSQERVEFNWDGEVVPVKRSKVAAIVYFHSKLAKTPVALCVAHLRDGSQIACRRLQASSDDSQLTLETPIGLSLNIPLREVLSLDFSSGKLAYLSDLRPLALKWTPLIGFPKQSETLRRQGEPRFNQAFTGSSLQLADFESGRKSTKAYQRGIAIRSRTEMIFEIPTGMQRFETLAGINPEMSSQGNVLLEFSSRGRRLWEGEIDGQDAPMAITFPLDGVRRLRIFVDYGENLDCGDQLHLINPRVSK